jgi:hypothetical protein
MNAKADSAQYMIHSAGGRMYTYSLVELLFLSGENNKCSWD